MEFVEYEKGILDCTEDIQRDYFSKVLGQKLYFRISKLTYYLGYRGFEDFIKKNYQTFYDTQINPHEIYNSDFYYKLEILIQNVKNAKFYQLSPLWKYLFVYRNMKCFDELLAIFFSEIVTVQNNLDSAEFILKGSRKYVSYQKIRGNKIHKKNLATIDGMSELIRLQMPKQIKIPLFTLGVRGGLIKEVSISLKNRGYIDSIEQFQFLFTISTEQRDSDFKINWNGTIGTLVYLFLILIDFEILETKEFYNLNSNILIFTSNHKKISKETVKVEKNRINKVGNYKKFARNAKNHNYSSIFEMISKLIK